AFDFRMTGMTDQHQHAPLARIALALRVHFRDQRTSRVENRQAALLGLAHDEFGYAMGAEYGHGALGDLGQLVDEVGALGLERFDDVPIVDDLMAHIDGRAVFIEGTLDDIDRPDDAGTKTPWLRQNDLH